MNIETALRNHGLRITKPRLALGQIVFSKHPTHWTAEKLHADSKDQGHAFPLATVYNTLNQMAESGLLRRIKMQGNLCYYDTNLSPHHHVYHTVSKRLEDIPTESIQSNLTHISSAVDYDIIVHAHD